MAPATTSVRVRTDARDRLRREAERRRWTIASAFDQAVALLEAEEERDTLRAQVERLRDELDTLKEMARGGY